MSDIPFDFPKLSIISREFLIIGSVLLKNDKSGLINIELQVENQGYQNVSELVFLPKAYRDYSTPRGLIVTGDFDLKSKFLVLPSSLFSFQDYLLLRGWYVAVFKDAFPLTDEKEVYIQDLIGKKVYNESGIFLGTIKELTDIPTPYPMMLLLTPNQEEKYLPLPQNYLVEVTETKVIVADETPL